MTTSVMPVPLIKAHTPCSEEGGSITPCREGHYHGTLKGVITSYRISALAGGFGRNSKDGGVSFGLDAETIL